MQHSYAEYEQAQRRAKADQIRVDRRARAADAPKKVKSLESELEKLDTEIGKLAALREQKVASQREKEAAIDRAQQAEKAALRSGKDSAAADLVGLQSDKANLSRQVSVLDTRIAELETEKAEVSKKMAALEIDVLDGELAEIANEIDEHESSLQKPVANLLAALPDIYERRVKAMRRRKQLGAPDMIERFPVTRDGGVYSIRVHVFGQEIKFNTRYVAHAKDGHMVPNPPRFER